MTTTTDSTTATEARQPKRTAEHLRFVPAEGDRLHAFDLVFALTGVCRAMDANPVTGSDDYEAHDIAARLATAARILADQVESRLEFDHSPPRRRRSPAGGVQ